ncbi:transcriptional regulator [Erythrobacter sp. HI0037]|nr:transcriptional regulator [Erythrobacter sp. HI0020]KZY16544.1 transcriptional regulator [Erythrobacter sp. HI0038]KZY18637.1 transcriptional regulator [Erythrobacter sp. HI0038]KZY21241.1 transcriptional regulator [Erythrobacter sp. HI0037]
MTKHNPAIAAATQRVFPSESLVAFAKGYPETPHVLRHALEADERFSLDALASLSEALPAKSIEYNRGDLPIGIDGKPGSNGLSIGETIRQIATSQSWAVLKNIEQVPDYQALLMALLEELRPRIEATTGELLTPQGFVFISSPNAVTPYHFDPEHNILLQLQGSKVMTQFPAGNPRYAPDEVHESYHLGGPRELPWDDALLAGGTPFAIEPGEAVYVPVMAPHFVRNGPAPSLSLSITWRSEWSYAEAGSRCFNGLVRKLGVSPRAPGRWPANNQVKSLAFRAWRKTTGVFG